MDGSLADDFLTHEGMISTVLGECMKEENAGTPIGDKLDKTPMVGWGSMLEQVCCYYFLFVFVFIYIMF